MRARKIDGNQNKLVNSMRAIGMSVRVTSMVGDGFVDVVAGYHGVNYLFEIKDPDQPPSGRQLTTDEQKFHDSWRGQVAKVETIDDVIRIINQPKK